MTASAGARSHGAATRVPGEEASWSIMPQLAAGGVNPSPTRDSVASAVTNDKKWERQLTDATNIDRLNIGAIPTTKLDWLQPHEGNIVDFLFRARAFQVPQERVKLG